MKKILLSFICLVIIWGCESPSDNEITEEENIIDINLSVSNSVINVNEIPELTIKITNTSGEEILLYKDSSEYKYLPQVSLEITPEISNTSSGIYNYGYGCLIKEGNFTSLNPKQSVVLYNNSTELFDKYSYHFEEAGTYKVSVIIDFDNVGIINWPSDEVEKAKLMEMFNQIPKESFTSNVIEITVK